MTLQSQSWSFALPSIVDPDPKDSVSLIADFGTSANFLTLNGQSSLEIADISKNGLVKEGMYLIKFKLNDGKDVVSVTFSLIVAPPPDEPPQPETQTPSGTTTE